MTTQVGPTRFSLLACAVLTICSLEATPFAAPPRPPAGFFEVNVGQAHPSVYFVGRGSDRTVLVGRDFLEILPTEGTEPSTRVTFVGATLASVPVGIEPRPGRSNYFVGSDPTCWQRDVPHFARVEMKALYPGIDLRLGLDDHGFAEFEFLVAESADPDEIQIRLGDRVVRVAEPNSGRLSEVLPGRVTIRASERTTDNLAVDTGSASLGPSVCFSTYLGGSGEDAAGRAVVDSSFNLYTSGSTSSSTNFPTKNPEQGTYGGGQHDAFIAKHDSFGTLVFATYIGGSGNDVADGAALDPAGNIVIAGTTTSANFPLQSSLQGNLMGPSDAFIAVLDATGSNLLFSTYLGGQMGTGDDSAAAVATDDSGSIYVAGTSFSSDFPVTTGAFQTSLNGRFAPDMFVAKLTPDRTQIAYATFLGGTSGEPPAALAVDSNGSAVVVGYTQSADFPLRRPIQNAMKGFQDAFVAKLTPDGSDLEFWLFGGIRG